MLSNPSRAVSPLIAMLLVLRFANAAFAEEIRPATLQRIAFGSCAEDGDSQAIWEPLAAAKPDLFLFIGDTVYADTEDMEVMKSKYDLLAAEPGYQKLLATCPILATWDDHDYGVNDGDATYPKKAESAEIMLDFFDVPADSPRHQREGVYGAYRFGPEGRRVQVILLDTRYFKSRPVADARSEEEKKRLNIIGRYVGTDEPAATVLGEAQWKWLEEQLRQPADVRLLVSSIQVVADEKGIDSWGNFPRERERLYKLIETTGAQGVLLVTGDVHFSEISRTDDGPYPLYDFTSSGLTHVSEPLAAAVNNFRVSDGVYVKPNFGVIDIDWEATPPTITLSTRGLGDEVAFEKTIRLDELKVTKAAEDAPASVESTLPELHLLEPFWRSPVTHRESVMFVQAAGAKAASARLYFPAEKILAIHSSDGKTTYELGKDVQLSGDGRELTVVEGSKIPRLQAAELFPPAGAPRSIGHKAGDAGVNVLFDNDHWFHDQQVEVTYAHAEDAWTGSAPRFSGEELPKTVAKLRTGKPLTIAVSGDSISAGGNASGPMKASPWMPAFPELVAAQLEHHFESDVTLHNRAVGGWTAANGRDDLDALLAVKPDLVIIAYGMNDVSTHNPEAYRQTIAGMLDRIHQANADTEVILVSTMLGHPEWVHTPPEWFPKFCDALASLTGPGVALADVTSLWQELLRQKSTLDLIGNGVNHPNDFGHRLYAQAILAMLVEPSVTPLQGTTEGGN